MLKLYIPYAHANNIFDIDIAFYKKHNVKFLLVDLDNTLDSYKSKLPSNRVFLLKKELYENNIEMYIVSNNTGKRVSAYADALKVPYVNSIGKPFAHGINNFLKSKNINKNDVMLIGDQLMTDIAAANRAKIKSIYVEKLVKEDQPTTRFNRIFEKPIKRMLIRKHRLIDWKER